MKSDFYTITYNNVIVATAQSKSSIDHLLDKLKQNPIQLKELIRHKRVIDLTVGTRGEKNE